jgi:hypothetical protein
MSWHGGVGAFLRIVFLKTDDARGLGSGITTRERACADRMTKRSPRAGKRIENRLGWTYHESVRQGDPVTDPATGNRASLWGYQ